VGALSPGWKWGTTAALLACGLSGLAGSQLAPGGDMYREVKRLSVSQGFGTFALATGTDRADVVASYFLRHGFYDLFYPDDICDAYSANRSAYLSKTGYWPFDQFSYLVELRINKDCLISDAEVLIHRPRSL
jgi:hypothetical protein